MQARGGDRTAPAGERTPLMRTWRLARVAGVDVRVHPTFLVLVGLALAGGFGAPVSGLLWLAMVFGSVLAHELAHSLVARRRGIPVRGIVLLPIGGVSEIEELPDRPADELAVAVAGPATSLVLAAVAGLLVVSTGAALLPVDLADGSFLHRLAWTNLFLAGFNLLPAFPMDGGRVLRALLTPRVGLERATRTAAALGRSAAVVMAVLGLLFDVWLVLIAAFVWIGSRGEAVATLVHVRLGGHVVRQVMVAATADQVHPKLVTTSVRDDLPLEEAMEALVASGGAAAAVVDGNGTVVGILRLEDIVRLLDERAAVSPPGATPPRSR